MLMEIYMQRASALGMLYLMLRRFMVEFIKMGSGEQPMIIVGIISRIIYRNEANGFTVLELTSEGDTTTPVVGLLPPLNIGERAEFEGDWTVHKTYGKQFKAASVHSVEPNEINAIINYLSSGLIKGVGLATAKALTAKFGEDTLEIIEKHPERLKEIPGIGKAKSSMIYESFMQQRATRDIFMGLQKFGMTITQAAKVYKLYGGLCLSRIEENPYRLIDDVENIGFKTADKIALNAGIEHDSPFRIRAGIKYALAWAREEGHTYLPSDKLVNTAQLVLDVDILPIERELGEMIATSELICIDVENEQAVFTPRMYRHEASCAKMLVLLNSCPPEQRDINIDAEIAYLEKSLNITLAPMQVRAVKTALTSGTMVITGGPGTGKTTILKFIISILNRMSLEYELCAPTGRAAKRMSEATGSEARTIHRLLEYGYGSDGFLRNEENPICADFIIVDEMSMVDISLMNSLLKAITVGTRLIMVGDADQLPSVGAGNVLRDIIKSGVIETIRLDEIFRQSDRSMIVTNAHLINKGKLPDLDRQSDDFMFEECDDIERVLERVKTLCSTGAELGTRDPLKDVQVLVPMKKGTLGVNNINACLQSKLNPPSQGKAECVSGEMVFREGDKIMQIKNDYKLEWIVTRFGKTVENGMGVFNGDLGTIVAIDKGNQFVEVLFDDERCATYSFSQLDEITLAYCASIHKSQGSEFPIVLLPLVNGAPMLLTRNLLYTAVTRARHRVYIIGRRECISAMVNNALTRRRYSAMAQFMQEIAPFTSQNA